MGYWGVKSYENDEASDAIDAGFERVHGDAYDDLMDDRSNLSYDEVQKQLGDARTLAAAVDALREMIGDEVPVEDWDDVERLALAGVVVRHAEFGVPVPGEWLDRAIEWLTNESLEWDEATVRRLRKDREVAMLKDAKRN